MSEYAHLTSPPLPAPRAATAVPTSPDALTLKPADDVTPTAAAVTAEIGARLLAANAISSLLIGAAAGKATSPHFVTDVNAPVNAVVRVHAAHADLHVVTDVNAPVNAKKEPLVAATAAGSGVCLLVVPAVLAIGFRPVDSIVGVASFPPRRVGCSCSRHLSGLGFHGSRRPHAVGIPHAVGTTGTGLGGHVVRASTGTDMGVSSSSGSENSGVVLSTSDTPPAHALLDPLVIGAAAAAAESGAGPLSPSP